MEMAPDTPAMKSRSTFGFRLNHNLRYAVTVVSMAISVAVWVATHEIQHLGDGKDGLWRVISYFEREISDTYHHLMYQFQYFRCKDL
jgi:hypothetical protein